MKNTLGKDVKGWMVEGRAKNTKYKNREREACGRRVKRRESGESFSSGCGVTECRMRTMVEGSRGIKTHKQRDQKFLGLLLWEAAHWYQDVMDAGDNALSSIPVRSTGPNNTTARYPLIHYCTPIYSFAPRSLLRSGFVGSLTLRETATSLINVITQLNAGERTAREKNRKPLGQIRPDISYPFFPEVVFIHVIVKNRRYCLETNEGYHT